MPFAMSVTLWINWEKNNNFIPSFCANQALQLLFAAQKQQMNIFQRSQAVLSGIGDSPDKTACFFNKKLIHRKNHQ